MADPGGNNSRLPAGALFSTAFPNVGVAAGALDSSGLDMLPLNLDASGNLKVSGSFTATLGGTSAVNITQVGGTAITLGQKVSATSFPVVIASDQSAIPVSGSITATNPAVGTTGTTAPTSADFVGVNVGGNLQGWSGLAVVNATAYAGRVDLSSLNGTALSIGQQVMTASIPVVLASNQSNVTTVLGAALPAGTNAIGTVSITQALPAGTNAVGTVSALQLGTWAVNLTQVGGTTLTFGQAVMATSIPVAIASNQSTLSVAGTLTAVISGTPPFNLAQVGATAISLGQKVSATSFPVVIASDQSNVTTVLGAAIPGGTNAIGTVSITQALPAGTNALGTVSITQALPAGTNAIGTVSALQVGTWTVNFAGSGISLRGSATTSGTAAVTVIAAQGSTTKIYVTGLQFGNTSGSTVVVQLNDSAASFFIVPSGGGNNPASFLVPLVLSSANASLTFSVLSTAVATIYVNAQGYGAT